MADEKVKESFLRNLVLVAGFYQLVSGLLNRKADDKMAYEYLPKLSGLGLGPAGFDPPTTQASMFGVEKIRQLPSKG